MNQHWDFASCLAAEYGILIGQIMNRCGQTTRINYSNVGLWELARKEEQLHSYHPCMTH